MIQQYVCCAYRTSTASSTYYIEAYATYYNFNCKLSNQRDFYNATSQLILELPSTTWYSSSNTTLARIIQLHVEGNSRLLIQQYVYVAICNSIIDEGVSVSLMTLDKGLMFRANVFDFTLIIKRLQLQTSFQFIFLTWFYLFQAFVSACSNILDETNSREWKNAQKVIYCKPISLSLCCIIA